MESNHDSPNVRRGRFLWMSDVAKKRYLEKLRKRIEDGFFFSDSILSRIVDDLAPVFSDTTENEA